jgi:hypothetical protein
MSYHDFEFVPVNRVSGWAIKDSGNPRIWWRARLTHDEPVLLTDKSDLREQETRVEIEIGTESPIGKTRYTGEKLPEPKWGGVIWDDSVDCLVLFIAVSRENFDRILAAVRDAKLPTITAGFGPEGAFDKLEGPIIEDETTGGYYWDSAKSPSFPIESCDFRYAQAPIDTDLPEVEEKIPGAFGVVLRGLGVGFTVAGNVITVLIALALFRAASTEFETAAVCLLVFIYLAVASLKRDLPRVLARIELSALARHLQLRTLVGAPTEDQEKTFLGKAHERLTKPGAKYWVNVAGEILIGLIAIYKLVMLAL